ncbi:MAG: chromosome segregation protein SMC, partial [Brevundimonas sp.]
ARTRPFGLDKAVTGARDRLEHLRREQTRKEARAQSLDETVARLEAETQEAQTAFDAAQNVEAPSETIATLRGDLNNARGAADNARLVAQNARSKRDEEARDRQQREQRQHSLTRAHESWIVRSKDSTGRIKSLDKDGEKAAAQLKKAEEAPQGFADQRNTLMDTLVEAENRKKAATDTLQQVEFDAAEADRAARATESLAGQARENRAALQARAEAADEKLGDADRNLRETAQMTPEELGRKLQEDAIARPPDTAGAENLLFALERERESMGAVNLRAEEEAAEYDDRLGAMKSERIDLTQAIAKLRDGIDELNAEGRERLLAAFEVINENFKALFEALFGGGQAELKLVESDDPLEAGLEIFACPPGKRLSVMSLMSGGEQALTAAALIFGVFLANPAPVCVLDEVDAPLDDANVDRFCKMLHEMRSRTDTRFICITHNPVTMSRMDRLYGVTMPERGMSQLVSVDLKQAENIIAA